MASRKESPVGSVDACDGDLIDVCTGSCASAASSRASAARFCLCVGCIHLRLVRLITDDDTKGIGQGYAEAVIV